MFPVLRFSSFLSLLLRSYDIFPCFLVCVAPSFWVYVCSGHIILQPRVVKTVDFTSTYEWPLNTRCLEIHKLGLQMSLVKDTT